MKKFRNAIVLLAAKTTVKQQLMLVPMIQQLMIQQLLIL